MTTAKLEVKKPIEDSLTLSNNLLPMFLLFLELQKNATIPLTVHISGQGRVVHQESVSKVMPQ